MPGTGRAARAVLVALALGVAAAPPAAAAPGIHAHRGGPYDHGVPLFPENAMSAFAAAASEGFTLELDVKLTSEDVPVVVHDATLDRTTDCTGRVDAKTVAQLQAECRLDVVGVPGSGLPAPALPGGQERIPTLAEALALARSQGAQVNLEIKNLPTDSDFDVSPAFASRVVDEIVASGFPLDRLIVQSFWPPNLDVVEARLPAAQTSLLTLQPMNEGSPAFARGRGYEWVSPGWPISAEYVTEAHALALRVVPYTLDREADIRAAAAVGVDAVISNDPRRARSVLGGGGPGLGPGGGPAPGTAGGPTPAIRLRATPRGVRPERRRTFRFLVTAQIAGHRRAIPAARVYFAGRRAITDARGRARIVARLQRRTRARAFAAGLRPGSASVAVLGRR